MINSFLKFNLLLLILSTSFQGQTQTVYQPIEKLIENDSFQEAIEKSSELMGSISDGHEKGRLMQLQADAYYYLNDIDVSLRYYLLAIEHFEDNQLVSNNKFYFESVSHAGFCYRELGNYDLAISYYTRSLKIAIDEKDTIEVAIQYANLGSVYGILGDIKKAGNLYLEAYAINLERKDTAALSFGLRDMAALEAQLGHPKKAILHYKESITLLEISDGNPNSLANRMGSLGSTYLEIGELDSAYYYLSFALDKHLIANDSIRMAFRWVDFSNLYNQQKEYDKSFNYAYKAQKYFKLKNLDQHLVLANLSMVKALNQLKKYDEAIDLIEATIELCKKYDLRISQKKAYLEYVDLLRKNHHYEKALSAFSQYDLLKESLLNIENKKAISLIEIKYKVDKSALENEILVLENTIIKKEVDDANFQLITILIISLITVGFIITFYFLKSKRAIAERLAQDLQVEALKQRLLELQFKHEGAHASVNLSVINEDLPTPLTDREYEALQLSLKGHTNSEVAEELFVSINTVKFHLRNIYQKLGVNNKKGVIEYVAKSS